MRTRNLTRSLLTTLTGLAVLAGLTSAQETPVKLEGGSKVSWPTEKGYQYKLQFAPSNKSAGWINLSENMVAPDGAVGALIKFRFVTRARVGGHGEVYLDDVTLDPGGGVPEAENVIVQVTVKEATPPAPVPLPFPPPPVVAGRIVPLFDARTKLEPDTTEETAEALITRLADRPRDRHAREAEFKAYDHYLPFYWEERSVVIEIVDRVAKGGDDLTINISSAAPLAVRDFRAFYRGANTVAEYFHNVGTEEVGPQRYTTTIKHNPKEGRALRIGDRMEFEFSPFLANPTNGRSNYYGTAVLYLVGRGIVPWEGRGKDLDSYPLPAKALLGGKATVHRQYSTEPTHLFKQMAGNMAPISGPQFLSGRRLHHTDFGTGAHSEQPNPVYDVQRGKAGPSYIAESCIACHHNNGRALPPALNAPMLQSVVKVARDARGAPHPELGSVLQPLSTKGVAEGMATIVGYSFVPGRFGDGKPYLLRKPNYIFGGSVPTFYSVRLCPPLVGMGLLEAISESAVLALEDPEDKNGDGISGRAARVRDFETRELRLGRFGYKGSKARLRHQIAGALNTDMGVTTSLLPKPDGSSTAATPELSNDDLADLTRYIATLGVTPRRDLDDPVTTRGEQLFASAKCTQCHFSTFKTSAHHPFAELRSQTIHPYTDLLLHDMGPALADKLGEGSASGSEWRTAPLWGIGHTAAVSGGEAYLHDGRARTLEEAILWHGGEAEASRESFRKMPVADRRALIRFLKSL